MNGFKIGDYVIADHAEFDTFEGRTWRVTAFGTNMLGRSLVGVADIESGRATVFYPSELSFEDGTRPEVQS